MQSRCQLLAPEDEAELMARTRECRRRGRVVQGGVGSGGVVSAGVGPRPRRDLRPTSPAVLPAHPSSPGLHPPVSVAHVAAPVHGQRPRPDSVTLPSPIMYIFDSQIDEFLTRLGVARSGRGPGGGGGVLRGRQRTPARFVMHTVT